MKEFLVPSNTLLIYRLYLDYTLATHMLAGSGIGIARHMLIQIT
jgi:Rod binding domain-containing protein